MLNFVTLTNDTVKTLPKTSYKESVTTTVENSILEEMIAPKNPSTLTNTVMNVLKEYIGTDEGNVNNMGELSAIKNYYTGKLIMLID